MGINTGFPGGSDGKECACSAEDRARSPGGEDPLQQEMATHNQYSCMENLMDRGAWQATVHGVAKSWTRLSN